MPKKRKGELPSGNIRKKIYDHSELCFDEHGNRPKNRTSKEN